jgi:hypothetical protein
LSSPFKQRRVRKRGKYFLLDFPWFSSGQDGRQMRLTQRNGSVRCETESRVIVIRYVSDPVTRPECTCATGATRCRWIPTSRNTVAPRFVRVRQCLATMDNFPEFMKRPANRIAASNQTTPGVEGYTFDGADGAKWHFGTALKLRHPRGTRLRLRRIHDRCAGLLYLDHRWRADSSEGR